VVSALTKYCNLTCSKSASSAGPLSSEVINGYWLAYAKPPSAQRLITVMAATGQLRLRAKETGLDRLVAADRFVHEPSLHHKA